MPILTYAQYAEIRHKTPYTLILKSGENFLYYFGERHSFNPNDAQWAELKEFWADFLDKTKDRKRIVFTEGGIRPVRDNEEQAILRHGGMGLITYLSHKENIETHSPEPDEKYERAELEKMFPRDVIQYYYFARVVLQWGRKQDPKPDFAKYMNGYLDSDKNESGWPDYDFSLDAMKKLHGQFFDTPFDERDTAFFYDASNPVVIKSDINRVSAASSMIRDEYMVNEILRYMDNGYSVFSECGCSHVVMQEPRLRELLEPASD